MCVVLPNHGLSIKVLVCHFCDASYVVLHLAGVCVCVCAQVCGSVWGVLGPITSTTPYLTVFNDLFLNKLLMRVYHVHVHEL